MNAKPPVLNPSGVTFEIAQGETLGFDRPRDGILSRQADRVKTEREGVQFSPDRPGAGSLFPAKSLGFRLRSTLGYFKGHPAGVQDRRSIEGQAGKAKLQSHD